MIRDTSRIAWNYLQEESRINRRQQSVLNVITRSKKPLTCKQVARRLGWEINRVSGRITELCKAGEIVSAGTVINPVTNRPEHTWIAVEQELGIGF